MEAPSIVVLLNVLQEMGNVPLERIVLRLTGSVSELFENLEQLKARGLMEVDGDESAVKIFAEKAKALEQQGLEPDALQEKLFEVLKEVPGADKAIVGLTKKGFMQSQRIYR